MVLPILSIGIFKWWQRVFFKLKLSPSSSYRLDDRFFWTLLQVVDELLDVVFLIGCDLNASVVDQ